MEVIEDWRNPFEESKELVSLSSGFVAINTMKEVLLTAKEKVCDNKRQKCGTSYRYNLCARLLVIAQSRKTIELHAGNRRKHIKVLDTKLTFLRRIVLTCLTEAEFSHLLHVAWPFLTKGF